MTRPLLCLLVLLSVLAPVGEIGITASPGDVETEVITPRVEKSGTSASELVSAAEVAAVVVPVLPTPQRLVITRITIEPCSRAPREHLLERVIGARGPPV